MQREITLILSQERKVKLCMSEQYLFISRYMRDYIAEQNIQSDKPTTQEIDVHESSKFNTDSTRVTTKRSGMKRIRPKTVSKVRARNPTNLYTIEEKSTRALKKNHKNQKSNAHVKFDEFVSTTSIDAHASLEKSKSRGKLLLSYLKLCLELKERSN